ncbi:PREDICTED: uncharacterized protein LOC107336051 [Acropora digitifera]|uniref:uncharacterized protein LOC107336051 n=1 Tax=Acropora digitifera TaxID=70779 RepID=UPI00077AF4E7|nr:PREDICTED: uncharacterized protein LOC107336051 [Acropora digitifera]
MGHFTGSHFVLHIDIALLGAMVLLTDGGKITWLEPPPFETVTDASSISRTSKQMFQGSLNEELSCKFILTPDLNITTVSMKFLGQPAVTFVPNVLLQVEPVFAEHFNVVWVPNKLTLILFNVTYADEGEYCCEVVTIGRSARSWIRKIQLLVLDRIQTTVSASTASKDPRQTMASSISGSQSPILSRESSITASEVGNPGAIIGIVIGIVVFFVIMIFIYCLIQNYFH